MKVLIIGSGGREYALYKKALSSSFSEVFQIPFNPCFENSFDINISDNSKIIEFVKEHEIDFTVVGGEYTLVNGIVDDFTNAGLMIFGPTKKASQIETSKSYAKSIMKKSSVATASYKEFDDSTNALKYIATTEYPLVIKYDGLADGKGVFICNDLEESTNSLNTIFRDNKFGESSVVVEEFLDGEEFSAFYIINDGKIIAALPIAQDYKRINDGNCGSNTGGMGAVTTSKFDYLQSTIQSEIIKPVLDEMTKTNNVYSGILYAGLISCSDGVKVIEFNARLGDPETEVVVDKLESNIIDLMYQAKSGKVVNVVYNTDVHICVVAASGGYPDYYEKGYEITGLENVDKYYLMNTTIKNDKLVSNGGRVLCICSNASTVEEAFVQVYNEINKVKFDNMYFRSDIGKSNVAIKNKVN